MNDVNEVAVNDGADLLQPRRARHFLSRVGKLRIRYRVVANGATNLSLRLLQYYFATLAHFSGRKVLSAAFDASRVGGLGRMVGIIARPDNLAAWLPPQAAK